VTNRLATRVVQAFAGARHGIALSILLLSSAGSLAAQSGSSQNLLTNDKIVQLERAKVGDDVIIGMIQTMPTKFLLDPNSVIRLKQQGVSDKVLAAMVARGSAAAAPPPPSAERQPMSTAERAASTAPAGTWEIRERKDQMTDEESFDAHLLVNDNARERVDVTATCEVQDWSKSPLYHSKNAAPPPTLSYTFNIAYAPKAGQGLERTAMPTTGTVESAPEFFGNKIGNDTVSVAGGGSCVYVRMRLEDRIYSHVYGGGCQGRNSVAITFVSNQPNMANMMGLNDSAPGDNPRVDAFTNSLGELMNSYAQAAVVSGQGFDATAKEMLAANKFLVELPLNNGDTSIVSLDVQQPSFRRFVARCGGDLARATPPPPPPPPPKPRPSMFAPGVTPGPWAQAMLNPPNFAGSVDQFAAALPGFLQKAAQAAGYDAQAFSKESASVVDAVRTCATITPAMATRATRNGPLGQGMIVMRDLGQQYTICQSGTGFGPNAQYPDTSLVVQINSSQGQTFREGKGFTAFVMFGKTGKGAYPVISATISGPG